MKTCCAIHNERKRLAGLDKPWGLEERQNDDLSRSEQSVVDRLRIADEGDMLRNESSQKRRRLEVESLAALGDEVEGVGMGVGADFQLIEEPTAENEDLVESEISHDILKRKLIDHFYWMYTNHLVMWPTKNGVLKVYNPTR